MADPTSQVETRAQRHANELSIVKYHLEEVADLSETVVTYIIEDQGFNKVSTLKDITLEDITDMINDKDSPLKRANKATLLKLLAIIDDILASEQPPTTVDQWALLTSNDELEAYEIATTPCMLCFYPSKVNAAKSLSSREKISACL